MKRLPIYLSLLLLLTCAKEDNTSLIEGYQLQISQLNSKITEYSNQVSQLQSTVNSLNSQVNTIPGLENTISSLNEQIAELEDTITTLTSEVSTIPGLNDEIASLEETIASLKEQIEELEIISNTRTLTVSSTEGGSVTGTGDYQIGTEVTITAIPDEGYEFTGWSDGETSLTRVVTINSDTTLSASFEILTFQLTIVDTEGGTVSVESGSYDYGTELTIVASPNENYHFIGFEEIDGFENTINITIDSNITIQPNFLIKDDGHKQRSNTFFDEEELDYLATENFIIWWDKDNEFLDRALTLKGELENIVDICLGYGMEMPLGSETKYINIFLYNSDKPSYDIIQNWSSAGVGTDGNGMPFFPWGDNYFDSKDSSELNNTNRNTLYHESFHVMQYKAGNFYGTFPYSLDNTWYTEATASWFGRKFGLTIPYDRDDYYSVWSGQPALNLQPQVSMWGGLEDKPYFSEISWSHGNHRYAMEAFFKYLDDENIINEYFIGGSFYSQTTLLPQEYLYNNIQNLENIYGDFASKYVSGIMFSDEDYFGIKEMIKLVIDFSCDWFNVGNCNEETNLAYNNQYVSEINESGTNGYVTPVEKNEAWSWTVVKINTSQQQSFTLDFQPDELGNEGTQSNFKLYLTNRENNLVQQVDFNGEINVDPNLDYFLVMVNTPQRFEGWETFDYQLKVTPVN